MYLCRQVVFAHKEIMYAGNVVRAKTT